MKKNWVSLDIVNFRLLVDKIMDCIDREWNNLEEREKRMRDRMNIMYPYNISHCKMWIDKVSNEDIARWKQLNKMEDLD